MSDHLVLSTPSLPSHRWVVTENWLTQKPHPNALIVTLISTLIIILGSFAHWNNFFDLAEKMPATPLSIFTDHQLWRAWSTLLVHEDFKHLGSNLFLFTILGYFLTGYFSLWFFPVAALFVGGLTNFIVLYQMEPSTALVGLSGVVYWMGGAWLVLYFLIENRRTYWQKTLRALGVALLLFMPSEAFEPSVSYRAHFVGFVLGVLSGIFYYALQRSLFRSADVSLLTYETEIVNREG